MSVLYVRNKDGTITKVVSVDAGGATDVQIAQAVSNYMAEHPVSGGDVDVSIDGETLVIAESSTVTIENETLIL